MKFSFIFYKYYTKIFEKNQKRTADGNPRKTEGGGIFREKQNALR